jgi:uncharacterized membrane protein
VKTRFLILIATAGCMLAQSPEPAPADALKAYLNLTDSQVQALQQIQQQDRQANRATMQKMRQTQASLDDLLQKGGADAATTGRMVLDIQEMQSSLKKSRSAFNAQAANTLTPEQKTKLATLQGALQLMPAIHQASSFGLLALPQGDVAMGGRFGRGPGGPGRHGPPPSN